MFRRSDVGGPTLVFFKAFLDDDAESDDDGYD